LKHHCYIHIVILPKTNTVKNLFEHLEKLAYLRFAANENRYEGEWKDGKKNGRGKFFYLDTGQVRLKIMLWV